MNRYKIIGILLTWLAVGLLHTLVLSRYLDLGINVLLAHALARAVIFYGLSLVLNTVVLNSNFSMLSVFQQVVNYVLLAVFAVGSWIFAGVAFDALVFSEETAGRLAELTVAYVAIGILLYIVVVQMIVIRKCRIDFQEIAGHTVPITTGKSINEPTNACHEEAVSEPAESLERIAVKVNTKIHVLPMEEVYFLASDGDYVMIHTENAKYLKEQTMKYFEEHLPERFVRVHRSYIVNSEKISRIELLEKQTYYLILKNNQRLKMSVGGYRELRRRLGL